MANSREYKAFRKFTIDFKRGVDPGTVTTVLYGNLLLTPEEKDKVRREGATDGERLDTLSDFLERRISTDARVYHKIVAVLKDEPALEPVGKKMQGQLRSDSYK